MEEKKPKQLQELVMIVAALLTNPNYYPKTNEDGLIQKAQNILDKCNQQIRSRK